MRAGGHHSAGAGYEPFVHIVLAQGHVGAVFAVKDQGKAMLVPDTQQNKGGQAFRVGLDAIDANPFARQLLADKAAHVFIATAAVADWRPAHSADQKIKKDGSGVTPQLSFVENPDILATIAQSPRGASGELFCVGFAAESHDLLAHATAKRLRKGVPLLVGNIGPATFGQDDNALLLVDQSGARELPRASKQALAVQLIGDIAVRLTR